MHKFCAFNVRLSLPPLPYRFGFSQFSFRNVGHSFGELANYKLAKSKIVFDNIKAIEEIKSACKRVSVKILVKPTPFFISVELIIISIKNIPLANINKLTSLYANPEYRTKFSLREWPHAMMGKHSGIWKYQVFAR